MQVENEVQHGVVATPLYWVFVHRREEGQLRKEVYFSVKIPVNLDIVHNGQRLTLRIIMAAELHRAALEGRRLAVDSWAITPSDVQRWVMG